MKFAEFIKLGKVRKSSRNISLIKSLIKMSQSHITTVESIELNETNSASIMVLYYEALREIIEAIALLKGYKVYSHEALTYFLKELGVSLESEKFDKFRKIRNNINYYGKGISVPETEQNRLEIKKIIAELKNKFLADFTENP